MRTFWLFLLCIGSLPLLLPAAVGAQPTTLPDCSRLSVQQAVDTAGKGDTLRVPAGSCTWKEPVILPSDKTLILKGSGSDATVIRADPSGPLLRIPGTDSRVTGLKLINGTIVVDGKDWRVDNCAFEWTAALPGFGLEARSERPGEHPIGLIHSCRFRNTGILIASHDPMDHRLWFQPLDLGGNRAVFIEDCQFQGTRPSVDCITSSRGGRYVFRRNLVRDMVIAARSITGANRAARSWEIYDNRIVQAEQPMVAPIILQAGTGVVFDNRILGDWKRLSIALESPRSCEAVPSAGMCDGQSFWDGNRAGREGYPCRDQIGRGQDMTLWTDLNAYPEQTSQPAHAWGNRRGSIQIRFLPIGCPQTAEHIQEGRDFVNADSRKPGYAPYTYPHPLRDPGQTLPAPSGLRIE